MLYRLLLALALLPLAACGDADDSARGAEPVDEPVAVADEPTDMNVTAQSTLDAVQAAGGLTQLAPDAAIENINGWIVRLGNVKEAPGTLIEGLETLKRQLAASPRDGEAIGNTLVDLGEETTAVAGADAALVQLGDALTAAGSTLRGY